MQPFDPFSGRRIHGRQRRSIYLTISHGLKKTIALVGGSAKSEARLDELTSQLAHGYDYTSHYYEAGNEPCFGIMPAYNWLGSRGKPKKNANRLERMLPQHAQRHSGR